MSAHWGVATTPHGQKIRDILAELEEANRRRADLEARINREHFDPELSRQLDAELASLEDVRARLRAACESEA